MSVVLVDSKYFGQYLTSARKTLKLRRAVTAKILSVSHRELIKIENNLILLHLTSASELRVVGKALRYFSQLLVKKIPIYPTRKTAGTALIMLC